jgi:hypothetical protein
MARGRVVDYAKVLAPGDAEEASWDGGWAAGYVVLVEQSKHTGPNLDTGSMAVAVVRRVLLENRDIDPVALELESLKKASNRAANLNRQGPAVSAMNGGKMVFLWKGKVAYGRHNVRRWRSWGMAFFVCGM